MQLDLRELSLITITSEARFKVRSVIFCLLFILATALALYSECAQAADHVDFGAEHEAPSMHCPDAFLLSNSQAALTIRSHSRNLSEVLPSIQQKFDSLVSVARFKGHPFCKPFSQQGLFRLQEVYRF